MNAGILKTMMPQLLEVAPNAIYVIVTNPCDVLTVLAQEQTGLPPERIFASGTVLDTSRLRWRLAERAGVSRASVHAYIVGEHGDTEFPLWSTATVGTVPILEWESEGHPRMTVDELDAIAVDVRDAAYKVIQGKGATNYAIGLSSARIVEAILHDEHAVMPVSTCCTTTTASTGSPSRCRRSWTPRGAHPIPQTPYSPSELGLMRRSADALREVAASLR